MNQKQVNMLMIVYNVMRKLPKKAKFNIGNWIMTPIVKGKLTSRKAVDCGTTACAIGWTAIYSKEWRKHLKINNTTLALSSVRKSSCIITTVARIIGLNVEDTKYMFYRKTDTKNNRVDVIKRIEEIINTNGYVIC